jgi:hypothetical protein
MARRNRGFAFDLYGREPEWQGGARPSLIRTERTAPLQEERDTFEQSARTYRRQVRVAERGARRLSGIGDRTGEQG